MVVGVPKPVKSTYRNGLPAASAAALSGAADSWGSCTVNVSTSTFDVLVLVSAMADAAPSSNPSWSGDQVFAMSAAIVWATLTVTVAELESSAELSAVLVAVFSIGLSLRGSFGEKSFGTCSVTLTCAVVPTTRPDPPLNGSCRATVKPVAAPTVAGWPTGAPASVHEATPPTDAGVISTPVTVKPCRSAGRRSVIVAFTQFSSAQFNAMLYVKDCPAARSSESAWSTVLSIVKYLWVPAAFAGCTMPPTAITSAIRAAINAPITARILMVTDVLKGADPRLRTGVDTTATPRLR